MAWSKHRFNSHCAVGQLRRTPRGPYRRQRHRGGPPRLHSLDRLTALLARHREHLECAGHAFAVPGRNGRRRGLLHRRAVGVLDGESEVSGFSSHRVDDGTHGVSVYVRGSVARRGIGSALLRSAEADTISTVATSIRIDASLAAVEFYRAHGYAELSRGMVDLVSGHRMPCVFMRKDLAAT